MNGGIRRAAYCADTCRIPGIETTTRTAFGAKEAESPFADLAGFEACIDGLLRAGDTGEVSSPKHESKGDKSTSKDMSMNSDIGRATSLAGAIASYAQKLVTA